MWNHHSLNILCLLDVFEGNTQLPSSLPRYFFFLTSCLHTFLVTKVHLVGVPHFWSRFLSPPASLSDIVSPFLFFVLHTYLHINLSLISTDLRKKFPLFLVYKNPSHSLHFFFEPPHFQILFPFFTFK